MINIKSYTDIEQSKKLAEFLPLKSADMYYPWYIEENGNTIGSGHRISIPSVGNLAAHKVNRRILSCWSLSALIDVLPNGIVMNKDSQTGKYHFSSTCIGTHITANNPIDACVAMILKLHELNLL